MSLTAIVNLAERLLNNSSEQAVDAHASSKLSNPAATANSEANTGDKFTPSVNSQQDAGLFQVRQSIFFSAAAEFLLSQTLQPLANPAATPAASQPTAALAQNAAITLVAPTPVAAAQIPTVNAAPIAAAPPATAATAIAPVAATTTTPANSTQGQLLALNAALHSLGLNNSQLAQIDQIASLIQNFNPLAFTSLVFQLEALAQATATPAPTATTANAPATGSPASAAGNTSGANTAGGFQIQELVIRFSGAQESFTQTGTGAQAVNSTLQLSAFNLQVEEVNLTLANQAGQSLQVTAPQSTAAATSQTFISAPALAKSTAA